MSVGFGVSAGDFIAAIELVGTIIDSLRRSGSASSEFRELISQLLSLEAALLEVKRLEFEVSQYAEVIALREAAAQCRRTIDAFLETVKKYQLSLGCGVSNSKLKDQWRKIKWAVCRKEDDARFKADSVGHTESIQLLLTTVQMRRSNIQHARQVESQKSLVGLVQEGFFNCMQLLSALTDQGKGLLKITTDIVQTNIKIFQVVLQIQHLITNIPGQIERQQPVYIIDALGRTSPFHLEFIRSADALIAVLRANFRKHGSGAEKIDKREFVIQDSATKRDIDLQADWEVCFHPGQRADKSMVFFQTDRDMSQENPARISCPKCNQQFGNFEQGRVNYYTCAGCGVSLQGLLKNAQDLQFHKVREDDRDIGDEMVTRHRLKYRGRDDQDLTYFQRIRIHAMMPEEVKVPLEQTELAELSGGAGVGAGAGAGAGTT